MARRFKVVVRKNGQVCGEMSYPSQAAANAAAAQMQAQGSAGLEALAVTPNRKPRRNPSIGRGTKHRDRVAAAVTKRLRAQGVPKDEATSRGFAIATAAELRHNPMAADLSSMPFEEFAKHVVIGKGYQTLSGRRFVRVHSRDNVVMTDVPVSDGDGHAPMKRAIDIKHRAYEQLRLHLVPQVATGPLAGVARKRRRNPAGSVDYNGAKIRIENGVYTVLPSGRQFSGPGGFVAAKKWIDQHGA